MLSRPRRALTCALVVAITILGSLAGPAAASHEDGHVSLELFSFASANPAYTGDELTISTSVTNSQPISARGVVVTNDLPAGVTFVSASTTLGTCSGTSTVTCNIGTLASGASADVTVRVVPTEPGRRTFHSRATTTTSTIDGASHQTEVEVRSSTIAAEFDWTMPPNLTDHNNDGVPEPPPLGDDYVPSQFTLRLDACASAGGRSSIATYRWELEGLPAHTTSDCTTFLAVPEEKVYAANLTITTTGGQTAERTRNITVQDRLVVVMGDSYASGEGNPHTPIEYGWNTVLAYPTWANRRCHRSMHAASARAALQIEKDDPKTSVSYLSRACSGATIAAGIRGPYGGVDPHDASPSGRLLPQIEQVRELVGERKIDDLLISIGGNDIGFTSLIASCLTDAACHQNSQVAGTFDAALLDLGGHYDAMRNDIAARLRVASTYVTEYPDFTTDSDGSRCAAIGADLLWGNLTGAVMNADESTWASTHVLAGLNGKLQDRVTAANAAGLEWHYVGGVASAFTTLGQYGHGYCVGQENTRDPDRWIRTFIDSCDLQGPPLNVEWGEYFCLPTATLGQFHPNEPGHAAIAQRYRVAMRANPPNFGPPPVPTGGGTGGGGTGGGGTDGGGTDNGGTGGGGDTGSGSGDAGAGSGGSAGGGATPTPLVDSPPSVGGDLPGSVQIPAGAPAADAAGKCSKLTGKKRARCVRRECGKLKKKKKKARYRACVRRVTRGRAP